MKIAYYDCQLVQIFLDFLGFSILVSLGFILFLSPDLDLVKNVSFKLNDNTYSLITYFFIVLYSPMIEADYSILSPHLIIIINMFLLRFLLFIRYLVSFFCNSRFSIEFCLDPLILIVFNNLLLVTIFIFTFC